MKTYNQLNKIFLNVSGKQNPANFFSDIASASEAPEQQAVQGDRVCQQLWLCEPADTQGQPNKTLFASGGIVCVIKAYPDARRVLAITSAFRLGAEATEARPYYEAVLDLNTKEIAGAFREDAATIRATLEIELQGPGNTTRKTFQRPITIFRQNHQGDEAPPVSAGETWPAPGTIVTQEQIDAALAQIAGERAAIAALADETRDRTSAIEKAITAAGLAFAIIPENAETVYRAGDEFGVFAGETDAALLTPGSVVKLGTGGARAKVSDVRGGRIKLVAIDDFSGALAEGDLLVVGAIAGVNGVDGEDGEDGTNIGDTGSGDFLLAKIKEVSEHLDAEVSARQQAVIGAEDMMAQAVVSLTQKFAALNAAVAKVSASCAAAVTPMTPAIRLDRDEFMAPHLARLPGNDIGGGYLCFGLRVTVTDSPGGGFGVFAKAQTLPNPSGARCPGLCLFKNAAGQWKIGYTTHAHAAYHDGGNWDVGYIASIEIGSDPRGSYDIFYERRNGTGTFSVNEKTAVAEDGTFYTAFFGYVVGDDRKVHFDNEPAQAQSESVCGLYYRFAVDSGNGLDTEQKAEFFAPARDSRKSTKFAGDYNEDGITTAGRWCNSRGAIDLFPHIVTPGGSAQLNLHGGAMGGLGGVVGRAVHGRPVVRRIVVTKGFPDTGKIELSELPRIDGGEWTGATPIGAIFAGDGLAVTCEGGGGYAGDAQLFSASPRNTSSGLGPYGGCVIRHHSQADVFGGLTSVNLVIMHTIP